LGLPVTCAAFDVNVGCSGWVYALGIAQGLLSSGLGRVGLILTAETPSRYVHPYDRSTAFLFGDAATATLVRVAHDGAGLQHLSFGTDGAGAGHVMIPAGGMRLPRSAETAIEHVDATGNVRSQNELYMNGPEVLNFTLSRIPGAIRQCLEEAALGPEDIDLWVLHQASDVVLSALQRKFRVAPERMAYRLADVGNTVGSATPLALQAALLAGKVRPGARVLVAGFGVGLSWAVGLLVWPG
jgi:3-oxoacyl-[acyl-carrier-protein] synthase-3